MPSVTSLWTRRNCKDKRLYWQQKFSKYQQRVDTLLVIIWNLIVLNPVV